LLFKKFKVLYNPQTVKFPDPDTGRVFTGKTIGDVASQIKGYREQNDLDELEYLPQVIENYLCYLPEYRGQCEPLKNPKRSVMQYVHGGIALLKNIAYRDFESQEVADQRSEICAACPHNEFPDRTHFPKWADEIANLSVGDRKSKRHADLGVCGICSCPLRPKVFFKGKLKLDPKQLEQMKALTNPRCWQPDLVETK
jgi:hypothetical protein